MGRDSLFSLHVDDASIVYSESNNELIAVGRDREATHKSIERLVNEFIEKGILKSLA